MRKTIAERLVQSKNEAPHFYLSLDCNIDQLLKIRTMINLKSNDKPSQVDFITFNLNIPFDGKQFTAVTSNLSISYNGSDYSMGVKSNQSGIGNITYEFLGKGAAAFLGKVPKDMLKLELKRYNFKMPEHTHFMKFNRADFEKKAKRITSKKSWFTINGSLDNFVNNLE